MPWWDYDPGNSADQQQFQMTTQSLLQRWSQQNQQTQRQNESFGIGNWLAGKSRNALHAVGGLGEDIATAGLKGLDWYDRNVVGNVWNDALGPFMAEMSGYKFNDNWKYENLNSWQRFGAGVVSDPTMYLGGAGAAFKGLKAASYANRMETAAKMFGGAEKGIRAADFAVNEAPFKAAGYLIRNGVWRPTAAGVTHVPIVKGFAHEFFGTLGRETTDALSTRAAVSANRFGAHALTSYTNIPIEQMSGETAREAAGRLLEDGNRWRGLNAKVRRGELITPDEDLFLKNFTDEKQAAYKYLGGGGTPTTKRLFDQFRRIGSGQFRFSQWGDETRGAVDDVIERSLSNEMSDPTAIGRLLDVAGNRDLSTRVLMGDPTAISSKQYQDLASWLERRKRAPIDMLSSIPESKTANDFLDHLSTQVYESTRKEIENGTKITRDYTGGFGDAANWFDPVYKKMWVNGVDRLLVRPMTEMILGFPFFAVGNVIEDLTMSTLGGGMSPTLMRTKFRVSPDEFMEFARKLGPDMPIPESLFENIGRKGDLAFSLQGSHAGGGQLSGLNQGLGGVVFGGRMLEFSNKISGDIRRAYWLRKMGEYAERNGLDNILVRDNPAWKTLPHGLADRARKTILMSGADPSMTPEVLRATILGGNTDADGIRQLIVAANLPEGAGKQYLLQNADALANPVSRERVLKETYDHVMRDVSRNMEAVTPQVVSFVEDTLKGLDDIKDLDTLLAFHQSFRDADSVVAQYFSHYRTEGARLASGTSTVAQHEHNLTYLKKAERLQERLHDAQERALPQIITKLKATGQLSDEGVKAFDELSKTQAERFKLLRQRQKERLAVKAEYGTKEWYQADQLIFDKFRPRLEELERRISDVQNQNIETWLARPKSTLPEGAMIGGGSEDAEKLPGFRSNELDQAEKALTSPYSKGQARAAEAGPEELAREEQRVARIQSTMQRFDELVGRAHAKGPVHIQVDSFLHGQDNFEAVKQLLQNKSRWTRDLPNVTWSIGDEVDWNVPLKAFMEKKGFNMGPRQGRVVELRFGGPKGKSTFHVDTKDLVLGRKPPRGSDRVGRANTLRTLESENPGMISMGTAGDAEALMQQTAQSGEVTTRKANLPRYTRPNQINRLPENQVDNILTPPINDRTYAGGTEHGLFSHQEDVANFKEDLELAADKLFNERNFDEMARLVDTAPGNKLDDIRDHLVGYILVDVDEPYKELASGILERYLDNPEQRNQLALWASIRGKDSHGTRYLARRERTAQELPEAALTEEQRAARASNEYERGASTRRNEPPSYIDNPPQGVLDDERAMGGMTRQQMEAKRNRLTAGVTMVTKKGERFMERQPIEWFDEQFGPDLAPDAFKITKMLEERSGTPPTYDEVVAALKKVKANLAQPTADLEDMLKEVQTGKYDQDAIGTLTGGGSEVPPPKPPVAAGGEQGELWPDMPVEAFMKFANPDPIAVEAAVRTADEKAAREGAARSWTTKEDVLAAIRDERAVAHLMNDPDALMQQLRDWDSVFAGTRSAKNLPVSDIGTVYGEAHKTFAQLAKAIDTFDNFKGVSPEVDQALNELLAESTRQRGIGDAAQLRQKWKETFDKATQDYHRYFTNYDDGRTVHQMMRHVFPFWRYEYQRWPRLATVATKHPWFVTNFYRFIQATGDGAVTVPGTDVRFNPMAGGLFQQLNRLMADGGFTNPYRAQGGVWENAKQLAGAAGFIPGPQVSVPSALAEGKPGNEIPTTLDITLSAAHGSGIPGISDLAGTIKETLPSSFDRYNVDQQLIAEGVHPFQATPEQEEAAKKRASRSEALGQFTGQMFRNTPEVRKEMTDAQAEAARSAGVPEELISDAVRHRRNPLEATRNGTRVLDDKTIQAIEEQHPEWEQLKALKSSFAGDGERAIAGEKFKSFEEKKKYQDAIEQELLPSYRAFVSGQIDGEEFRKRRTAAMNKIQGAKEYVDQRYPHASTQATLAEPGTTQRKDVIRDLYWALEPGTSKDGGIDFGSLEKKRADLLASVGANQAEIQYAMASKPRWKDPLMNSVEEEYKTAQGQMEQYQGLPKYPGLMGGEQDLAEKGISMLETIRKNAPQLTQKQALAVLARHDPVSAMYARKAITIQNKSRRKNAPDTPRKAYWNSNPLLDKYYGG